MNKKIKKLKLNEIYSNFKLISRKKYEEIDSFVNIFEHQELGTELFFIENEDKKRAFEISFRTPSVNSKGVQHILEHSVFRGSRKYDFGNEETFALLIKNSMVSFLNAGTYPDKTVYPFSTNLESEFMKVMDVYMDAVLFPNILKNKNFFKQEGWRFDKDEKGNIFYNGVVFNEMKGAYANEMNIRDREIMKKIFKDTQESFSSGGDPNEIIDLSWEELNQYHKKYYHPTNATIYIYGDLDILKTLEKIEDDFLSNFKKGQKSEKIKIQSKFDKVTKEVKFLSAKEKKASDFSISFLIDEQSKIEDKIILNFLLSFLTESESSILKKNIINSKLVDDFGGYLEDGFNQYYLNFYFSGIESADGEKIEKIFYDSLSEISEKGIDREVLKSLLESFEYEQALKKYNSEKGLSLIDSINKYNNYGYSYEHLFFQKENLEILKNLLQKKDKTLENYIDRFILKNDSKVTLTLKATKVFDPYKKITEKLQKINSDKNSKEFKEIEKEIENFKEYENSITESKSVILPPKRSQIPREAIKNKFQKKIIENDDNKIKYFYSQIPEKNIKKVSLYFDAMAVSEDDLQKYRLLSKLLPHFTTKGKTREENEKEVNNIFGQFAISNIFGKNIETLNIYSKLVFKIGFLLEKEEKVLLYLNNFLKNIDFNKDIILEKLDLWAKEMRSSIAKNGSAFAMQNAKAKIDTIYTIGERISGIEFLIFIENLKKEITEDSAKMEQLICDFKNIFKKITLENDLQIAITANESDFEFHKKINLEKNNEIEKHSYHFKNEGNNEAIIVNSLTNSFNMVAIPILENDKEILKFIALGNFLTFGFIWKKIREEGGAYGGKFIFSFPPDIVTFYSYMDSRVSGTYDDFEKSIKYLQDLEKNNEVSDVDILGMIASALSGFLEEDKKISVSNIELETELSSLGNKRKTEIIKNILDFKKEDFKKLADIMEKNYKNHLKTTIGPKNKIEKDKKIFDKIWELK